MDYDKNIPAGKPLEEQYRSLLTNLAGVLSAKVSLDAQDNIREIHILSSANRNVKQVVRDVRSAISSFFDIDVDHRLISVAQMKDDPSAGEDVHSGRDSTRLRCGRIMQSVEDGNYTVTVTLKHEGQSFDGSASGRNTELQRMDCIVNAVLNSVHNFLGKDGLFRLLAVKRVDNMPLPAYLVQIEFSEGYKTMVLVGAAEVGQDEALSIEHAALDALNRRMSIFLAEALN